MNWVETTPEVLEELVRIIQRRLYGRIRGLRLVQRGSGLVLEGQSKTYYVKQLAQHALMETVDWPIVANDIQVV